MKKFLVSIATVFILLTSFSLTSCASRLVVVKPAPKKKVIVVKKRPVERRVVVVKRY